MELRTSLLISLLLSLAAWTLCAAEKVTVRRNAANGDNVLESIKPTQYRFRPPVQAAHGGPEEELELLDICLVASVDGKFHALNRTSGQMLWSMNANSSPSSPAALDPLVRTQHTDPDPDFLHHDEHNELYIIEPQSGDIFVLPSWEASLQRLPFTMPQLVDMSPFGFSGDDENRMFVGRKETTLLVVELETGRVKNIVNSNCPWDPFGDLGNDQSSAELDLDELDGTKPPKVNPVSTEVLIGRTDYYVTIYTKAQNPGDPRPPPQELTFSTYGPNNQDHAIQGTYRRAPDDMYIQATSKKEIIAFKAKSEWADSQLLWANTFKDNIVAVFDVLQNPSRQNPMVLLQPQPRLQDLLPNFDFSGTEPGYDLSTGGTYIGLIDENKSLYALSPEHYPLALFADKNFLFDRPNRNIRTIDAPPGAEGDTELHDLPVDIDSVARLIRERERCSGNNWDRACVVGSRPVAASEQSRLSRLLPDKAHVEETEPVPDINYGRGEAPGETNFSQTPVIDADPRLQTIGESQHRRIGLSGGATALAIFLVGLWYLTRKASHSNVMADAITAKEPAVKSSPNVPAESTENRDAVAGDESTKHIDFALQGATSPEKTNGHDPLVNKEPSLGTSNMVPLTPSPSTQSDQLEAASSPLVMEDGEGDDESDKEADAGAPAGKKKAPRRRKRGKKHKGQNNPADADQPVAESPSNEDIKGDAEEPPTPLPRETLILSTPTAAPSTKPQLVVTDEILGYGSHGTLVFRGELQGRAVAVKRLLQDFVTLASREVNILQDSDDHPNVIRYYYQEKHANFLYIALELCPASLADVIERPDLHRDISNSFDPKRALMQITAGLRHLHALKIVHRDIKPQNILVSAAKKGAGANAGHRMLISDFGLCKRLEIDQTSFLPTAHGGPAAGTPGWRAPEVLRGDVKLDEPSDERSQSSKSSIGTAVNGAVPSSQTRLTKSIDIFALGCLFYYILTSGSHPYGDRYERDINIMKDEKSLSSLESFGEEGLEAIDLISSMLQFEASKRPDTATCLAHPFFWNPARRLTFLQDASDRFEIMCRDPRDPDLIELEKGARDVVGHDWQVRLDRVFLENLGKFRKYDGKSVQDLMRALRNKKHHYQDLPENVKRHLGPLPDGFLAYFTRRFPLLFMHVHSVIARTNLRYESMFKSYFELLD